MAKITYTRGDRIPPSLRDRRFTKSDGTPSKQALLKYWRLLPDGSPDPDCKPFWRKFEIELVHRAYLDLGEYQIDVGKPGPPNQGWDRQTYDKQRYESRKMGIEQPQAD